MSLMDSIQDPLVRRMMNDQAKKFTEKLIIACCEKAKNAGSDTVTLVYAQEVIDNDPIRTNTFDCYPTESSAHLPEMS